MSLRSLRIGLTLLTLTLVSSATAQSLFPIPQWAGEESTAGFSIGDFDNDGHPDLAMTTSFPGVLSILRGDSSADFVVEASVERVSLSGLAVGDLDLNGASEILFFEGYPTAQLVVLARSSDGTLIEIVSQPTSIQELMVVELAQLDGDGIPDLIYVGRPEGSDQDQVITRLGNGDGSFGPESAQPCSAFHSQIEVCDFDGDGQDDIVLRSRSSDVIELALALPDGTLSPLAPLSDLDDPRWMESGDFNGDGLNDLVSAYGLPTLVQLRLGNGDGTFRAAARMPSILGLNAAVALDLDEDNDLDLLVEGSGHLLIVHYNNGSGEFTPGPEYYCPTTDYQLADINGDGAMDVLGSTSSGVTALLSDGMGSFRSNRSVSSPGGAWSDLSAGSWNSDGFADFAAIRSLASVIEIFSGAPTTPQLEFTLTAPSSTRALRFIDWDSDGDDDLVALGDGELVTWRRGSGGFEFAEAEILGFSPIALDLGDLDADGHLDVLVVNEASDSVELLRGGASGFVAFATWPTVRDPNSVGVADTNGDGHLDVVVSGDLGLYVHFGSGDGSLASPAAPVTHYTSNVVTSDLDGDGAAEIICSSGSTVIVVQSTSLTEFATSSYVLPRSIQSMVAADINGDGDVDLVAAPESAFSISVQFGDGSGALQSPKLYAAQASLFIQAADFTGDGRLDLIGSNTFPSYAINLLPQYSPPAPATPFVRGDANQDGGLDIGDPLSTLNQLFLGDLSTCVVASDANDDGARDLADVVFLLDSIFTGGALPTAPYPDCGVDPTPDTIECVEYDACP